MEVQAGEEGNAEETRVSESPVPPRLAGIGLPALWTCPHLDSGLDLDGGTFYLLFQNLSPNLVQ